MYRPGMKHPWTFLSVQGYVVPGHDEAKKVLNVLRNALRGRQTLDKATRKAVQLLEKSLAKDIEKLPKFEVIG